MRVKRVEILGAMERKKRGRMGRLVQRIALAISPPLLGFVSQVSYDQNLFGANEEIRTWQMSVGPG